MGKSWEIVGKNPKNGGRKLIKLKEENKKKIINVNGKSVNK